MFDGQGACFITYDEYDYDEKLTFTPVVLFHKGDKKEEINERLVEALLFEIRELKNKLVSSQRSINQKSKNQLEKLGTPFVSGEDSNCAIRGFNEQKESLELKIKDCDRLESLCS